MKRLSKLTEAMITALSEESNLTESYTQPAHGDPWVNEHPGGGGQHPRWSLTIPRGGQYTATEHAPDAHHLTWSEGPIIHHFGHFDSADRVVSFVKAHQKYVASGDQYAGPGMGIWGRGIRRQTVSSRFGGKTGAFEDFIERQYPTESHGTFYLHNPAANQDEATEGFHSAHGANGRRILVARRAEPTNGSLASGLMNDHEVMRAMQNFYHDFKAGNLRSSELQSRVPRGNDPDIEQVGIGKRFYASHGEYDVFPQQGSPGKFGLSYTGRADGGKLTYLDGNGEEAQHALHNSEDDAWAGAAVHHVVLTMGDLRHQGAEVMHPNGSKLFGGSRNEMPAPPPAGNPEMDKIVSAMQRRQDVPWDKMSVFKPEGLKSLGHSPEGHARFAGITKRNGRAVVVHISHPRAQGGRDPSTPEADRHHDAAFREMDGVTSPSIRGTLNNGATYIIHDFDETNPAHASLASNPKHRFESLEVLSTLLTEAAPTPQGPQASSSRNPYDARPHSGWPSTSVGARQWTKLPTTQWTPSGGQWEHSSHPVGKYRASVYGGVHLLTYEAINYAPKLQSGHIHDLGRFNTDEEAMDFAAQHQQHTINGHQGHPLSAMWSKPEQQGPQWSSYLPTDIGDYTAYHDPGHSSGGHLQINWNGQIIHSGYGPGQTLDYAKVVAGNHYDQNGGKNAGVNARVAPPPIPTPAAPAAPTPAPAAPSSNTQQVPYGARPSPGGWMGQSHTTTSPWSQIQGQQVWKLAGTHGHGNYRAEVVNGKHRLSFEGHPGSDYPSAYLGEFDTESVVRAYAHAHHVSVEKGDQRHPKTAVSSIPEVSNGLGDTDHNVDVKEGRYIFHRLHAGTHKKTNIFFHPRRSDGSLEPLTGQLERVGTVDWNGRQAMDMVSDERAMAGQHFDTKFGKPATPSAPPITAVADRLKDAITRRQGIPWSKSVGKLKFVGHNIQGKALYAGTTQYQGQKHVVHIVSNRGAGGAEPQLHRDVRAAHQNAADQMDRGPHPQHMSGTLDNGDRYIVHPYDETNPAHRALGQEHHFESIMEMGNVLMESVTTAALPPQVNGDNFVVSRRGFGFVDLAGDDDEKKAAMKKALRVETRNLIAEAAPFAPLHAGAFRAAGATTYHQWTRVTPEGFDAGPAVHQMHVPDHGTFRVSSFPASKTLNGQEVHRLTWHSEDGASKVYGDFDSPQEVDAMVKSHYSESLRQGPFGRSSKAKPGLLPTGPGVLHTDGQGRSFRQTHFGFAHGSYFIRDFSRHGHDLVEALYEPAGSMSRVLVSRAEGGGPGADIDAWLDIDRHHEHMEANWKKPSQIYGFPPDMKSGWEHTRGEHQSEDDEVLRTSHGNYDLVFSRNHGKWGAYYEADRSRAHGNGHGQFGLDPNGVAISQAQLSNLSTHYRFDTKEDARDAASQHHNSITGHLNAPTTINADETKWSSFAAPPVSSGSGSNFMSQVVNTLQRNREIPWDKMRLQSNVKFVGTHHDGRSIFAGTTMQNGEKKVVHLLAPTHLANPTGQGAAVDPAAFTAHQAAVSRMGGIGSRSGRLNNGVEYGVEDFDQSNPAHASLDPQRHHFESISQIGYLLTN